MYTPNTKRQVIVVGECSFGKARILPVKCELDRAFCKANRKWNVVEVGMDVIDLTHSRHIEATTGWKQWRW